MPSFGWVFACRSKSPVGTYFGAPSVVGSRGSSPAIAASTSAASSTLRAMGPSLSSVQESSIAPARLTLPKVGRTAVVAQRVEGETSEPQVSEPIAKTTAPAAVALAEPADEPLEPWVGFQGLRVLPPTHTSPHASSPSESFATSTAPAASRRSITAASASGTRSANSAEP